MLACVDEAAGVVQVLQRGEGVGAEPPEQRGREGKVGREGHVHVLQGSAHRFEDEAEVIPVGPRVREVVEEVADVAVACGSRICRLQCPESGEFVRALALALAQGGGDSGDKDFHGREARVAVCILVS